MLVQFFRFIYGSVQFKAEGRFPERFLNLAARNGIVIWDNRPEDKMIFGCMKAKDYKKVHQMARKSKIRIRICKKCGLPFIAARYKSRSGLAVGGIAGLIVILILSNFIWVININGTQNVSPEIIREYLNDAGITVGCFKHGIDSDSLKRNILLNVEQLKWASVNLSGCVADIEVKEKTEKPVIDNSDTPCNIRAKRDGVITEIKAKSGVAAVLKGSGVVKDQLLVSGIIENSERNENKFSYTHALAEVYADVKESKEIKINKNFNYSYLSGNNIIRNRARFLWLEFPINLSFNGYENSAYDYSSESLFINDCVLPVGISTQSELELLSLNASVDEARAKSIINNSSLLYEIFEKSDSSTVKRSFDIKSEKNCFVCRVDYIFNENIAYSLEFSVTE